MLKYSRFEYFSQPVLYYLLLVTYRYSDKAIVNKANWIRQYISQPYCHSSSKYRSIWKSQSFNMLSDGRNTTINNSKKCKILYDNFNSFNNSKFNQKCTFLSNIHKGITISSSRRIHFFKRHALKILYMQWEQNWLFRTT